MRSRASWRTEQRAAAAVATPYRGPFHWDLAPAGPRLELASLTEDRELPATVPAGPTLLTGGPVAGARATLDALEMAAPRMRFAVARCGATPGVALRPLVIAALDRAVETVVRADPSGSAGARMRAVLEVFRSTPDPEDIDFAPVLAGLTAAATEARWGLVLVVDDLHAAARRDSEALLDTAATVARRAPSFRPIASASHAATVGVEARTRRAWDDVPLRVRSATLAELVGRVAWRHHRRFDDEAVEALVQAGRGIAPYVLAHAAATWESTRRETITAEQVRAAASRDRDPTLAELHRSCTAALSIGQRRCLRVVAQDGERAVDVDEVARRLGHGTRFGLSGGMLDTVLTSLVQRGLLIVHDGRAELAIPALAALL